MQFNTVARGSNQPQRITFSCDLKTIKLIKKHMGKFNNCQSDLIKKAVFDLCEKLESLEKTDK